MPVKIRKIGKNKYQTFTPSGIKGKKMTLRNAHAQARLLRAVDYGWRPSHKKKGRR